MHGRKPRYVGLRPYDKGIDSNPQRSPQLVTVTGTAHDCQLDWGNRTDANGDMVISMGTGYCHYYSGAVLSPVAVRGGEAVSMTRAVGPAAARRIGDLTLASPDWRYRAEVLGVVARYLTALRSDDRRGFADLHNFQHVALDDTASYPGATVRTLIAGAFDAPASAFAALRQGKLGAPSLFVPLGDMKGDASAYVCFFPPAFAAAGWPVSTIDLANGEGRPYACLRIYQQRFRRDEADSIEWLAETQFVTTPFREP